MPDSPAKKRVLNFFNNEVSNYIIKDIEVLDKIRPDKDGGFGACTVAHALMLFAVIDYFGYLIRDDDKADKRETSKNFEYFMSKANLLPEIYKDKPKIIVELFRHGLMHQYFPKACGITKSGLACPLIIESSEILHLNVDVLSKDVSDALRKIKQNIEISSDNRLAERINERLDKLAKEDYNKLKKLNKY